MITENLSTLKIHRLTENQYKRELAAGRIDETAIYLTPEVEYQDLGDFDDPMTPLDTIVTEGKYRYTWDGIVCYLIVICDSDNLITQLYWDVDNGIGYMSCRGASKGADGIWVFEDGYRFANEVDLSTKFNKTGGTLYGKACAGSAYQDPSISLLRNSMLVSDETNPTVNGEICWIYE